MTRDEILKKINEIFHDIFSDDSIVITESSNAADVEEWDSLNNIQIVIAVEKTFKVKFKSSDIRAWAKVGDMVDAISKVQG